MNKTLKVILSCSIVVSALLAEEVKVQQNVESLIMKNVESDPQLKQQTLQVKISDLELEKTWGDWLPKVDLTAYKAREEIKNPNGDITRLEIGEFKIDAKQLVYDFKIDSEIKKKRLDKSGAKLTKERTTQGLVYRNLTAYFSLVKEFQQLENANNNKKNIEKQLVAENKKMKAGKGSKTDLLRVQAVYQRANINVNTARAQLTNAVSNYYRNFYSYPVKVAEMKLPNVPYQLLPKTVEEANEIALVQNPQLKILNNNIEKIVADRSIDMAKFYPKVELEGKAQFKDDVGGVVGLKNEYLAKVVVSYNLFNGVKDYKSLEINSLKRLQQKESLIDNRNAQTEKVSVAWQAHEQAKKNYESAMKEVDFYDEYLSKIDRQRELGKADMLDVLDAQTKQLEAKSSLIETSTQKDLTVFALLFEMGVLNVSNVTTN